MADINFSQLTSASAVGASDQLLIRRNNALSGSAGFARASTATVEKGLGVYSTVQSNSAAWSGITNVPTTLTYAATVNPAFSDGQNRQITMTGNLTLNEPTGGSNGSVWQVRLIASGAVRTITLGTNIVTPTGTIFDGAVANGSTRLLQMIYNGTKWWVVRNQEFTS